MATKTYKQIANIIESGEKLNAREKQAWNKGQCRFQYTVEIDGETFEVKAASWNKLNKEFNVKTVKSNELGNNRFIYCEISA